MLAMLITYGDLNPVFPEATYSRALPLLAVLYSRILWWPLWSATEEMTYNGYALPRLNAMTKSPWLSVAIVSFFWSSNIVSYHWPLPGTDYMFLTFHPTDHRYGAHILAICRLIPLIIGHWLMDLFSVVFLLRIG